MRSDLTDHYYEELQEMKARHALELEQIKAKLSDSHLRGTSRIHFYETKTFALFMWDGANAKKREEKKTLLNIFVIELTRSRLEAARQVEVRKDIQKIYTKK